MAAVSIKAFTPPRNHLVSGITSPHCRPLSAVFGEHIDCVDSKGKSSISLNLDVTDSLTVKGKVGSDDDTGIGIFFQRDY